MQFKHFQLTVLNAFAPIVDLDTLPSITMMTMYRGLPTFVYFAVSTVDKPRDRKGCEAELAEDDTLTKIIGALDSNHYIGGVMLPPDKPSPKVSNVDTMRTNMDLAEITLLRAIGTAVEHSHIKDHAEWGLGQIYSVNSKAFCSMAGYQWRLKSWTRKPEFTNREHVYGTFTCGPTTGVFELSVEQRNAFELITDPQAIEIQLTKQFGKRFPFYPHVPRFQIVPPQDHINVITNRGDDNPTRSRMAGSLESAPCN